MGTPEQAANKIKELAINQMKNNNYKSAWDMLLQAKNLSPALKNLDHMLFVSNLLQSVDMRKPGYGVNWLPMLRLPSSAHMSTIQNQFKEFINCLEAIKGEFPGTIRAQGILRAAMQDFCQQEKNKQVNFQHVVCGLAKANDGANSGSVGTSKRKMPVEDQSSRRVTRQSSSAKQSEILGINVGVATENLASDGKGRVVGDHCKLPGSELCDVINVSEEEPMDIPKIMKHDSHISKTAGSRTVVEENDDVGNQCESNNGDGENQSAKDDKQEVTVTPGSIERKTEENYSSPELKVLFDAIPQSPHYRSLSALGGKFRHYMIMGIEHGFMAVAEQLHSLANAEDVKCNASNITSELMYLETMGYDVQRLTARLEELCQLAEQKQAEFEACEGDNRELNDWKTQREAFEAKFMVLQAMLAELGSEIQRMEEKLANYRSAIDSQKAKEAEIELRIDKRKEKARLLDSEIQRIAKLPW